VVFKLFRVCLKKGSRNRALLLLTYSEIMNSRAVEWTNVKINFLIRFPVKFNPYRTNVENRVSS